MDEAFVYLWYDAGWKQTGGSRYYIGKHKGGLDSGYVCSSNYMKPEWEDRGCKHKGCTHLFGEEGHHGDFHRRVLAYGSEKEMISLEVSLLESRKERFGNTYYNRVVMWCSALSGKHNLQYKHGKYGTKEYQSEYSRKYYIDNKDKILEYNRKYRIDNKDKVLEGKRKYRLEHKDKIAEGKRKHYMYNKDKLKLQRLQKEKVSEQ